MKTQQEAKTHTINTKQEQIFEKVLKEEMTTYESDGVRGKYLFSIHDYC